MGATIGPLVRQGFDALLDLIYPPRCLICDRDVDAAICPLCYAAFLPIPEPSCARCGRPIDSVGATCRFCAAAQAEGRGWTFVSARAASVYEGTLRHAIHRLKYGRVEALGEPLGAHLANRCIADGLWTPTEWQQIDLVVPMPLHPARLRRRGFNQAELLARPIAEMIGVELDSRVLRRAARAPAQVGLTLDARRANVRAETFHIRDPATVQGKGVLLVDDVFTTGTTAEACARALHNAGAATVHVATLAAGD